MTPDTRPSRRSRERAGFTLIETIVAMVILSVGILAVATLSSTAIYQVRRGQDLTNTALAAQQVMEELATTPFDSIAVGEYGDSITMGGLVYRVAWTVVDLTDSLGARGAQIKGVTVYAGGGILQSISETFEMTLYKPSETS